MALQGLTLRQKISITVVATVVVVGLILLVIWVNKPGMGVLFSNLASQDANKIVEKLREKTIPYELSDGGKTILVPQNQIYELRLTLSGEGLPQSSVIGYEIFDKTNLGVSDFVQKLNYRRALEGELARTIAQLEEVEGARVHIVLPEKTLFKEDQKPATASVILKLRSEGRLRQENIQGISHLIASSVEGLEVNNVTILDSRGNLLSTNQNTNTLAALSSTQYELQRNVENYLASKAQSLIDGVVGSGNAIVRVNAELDFKQAQRTIEQYDPSTVVRSEQNIQEKSVISDTLPPSSKNNQITNYEIGKTVEHVVDNVGSIKRLSVAVLVNDVVKIVVKDGKQVPEYKPRSSEQMTQLTDLVKQTIGFDAQRQDQISVQNITFDSKPDQEFQTKETPLVEDAERYVEKVVVILAMVIGMVVLRSIVNRVRSKKGESFTVQSGSKQREREVAKEASVESLQQIAERKRREIQVSNVFDPDAAEIPEELLIRNQMRQQVASYVKEKPGDAVQLIKVWLNEDIM